MPLRIQLEDVIETLSFGEAPSATIRVRHLRSGHRVEAQEAAADRRGVVDEEALRVELDGLSIPGWDGVEDIEGRPVPFEAPPAFVEEAARANAALGEKALPPKALARRAQARWVSRVLGGFPGPVRDKIDATRFGDLAQVNRALGNSAGPSVNA